MRVIQRILMPGLLSFPPDMDFFELRSLGAMFGDTRTFRECTFGRHAPATTAANRLARGPVAHRRGAIRSIRAEGDTPVSGWLLSWNCPR